MTTVGLTEVLAPVSLATDLGSGFPPEKGLRTCLAALAVGHQAGLDDRQLADLFQAALLLSLGCTSYATENAWHFDDDLAFQRTIHTLDAADPQSLATFGAWACEQRAAELRSHFLEIASTVGPQATAASCEASRALGAALGLRPNAIEALDHVHERWDGLGIPGSCSGESLPLIVRVMHLAEQAVIAHGTRGSRGALAEIARRAGGHLDPELTALVVKEPDPLCAALDAADPLTAVLEAEPGPKARIDREELDGLAAAFGDLADLKHGRGADRRDHRRRGDHDLPFRRRQDRRGVDGLGRARPAAAGRRGSRSRLAPERTAEGCDSRRRVPRAPPGPHSAAARGTTRPLSSSVKPGRPKRVSSS